MVAAQYSLGQFVLESLGDEAVKWESLLSVIIMAHALGIYVWHSDDAAI